MRSTSRAAEAAFLDSVSTSIAAHLPCRTGDIVPRTGRPITSVYNSSSAQLTNLSQRG